MNRALLDMIRDGRFDGLSPIAEPADPLAIDDGLAARVTIENFGVQPMIFRKDITVCCSNRATRPEVGAPGRLTIALFAYVSAKTSTS